MAPLRLAGPSEAAAQRGYGPAVPSLSPLAHLWGRYRAEGWAGAMATAQVPARGDGRSPRLGSIEPSVSGVLSPRGVGGALAGRLNSTCSPRAASPHPFTVILLGLGLAGVAHGQPLRAWAGSLALAPRNASIRGPYGSRGGGGKASIADILTCLLSLLVWKFSNSQACQHVQEFSDLLVTNLLLTARVTVEVPLSPWLAFAFDTLLWRGSE